MQDNRKINNSCVYCILNIVTNERYVGSTTNFSDRKGSHLYDVRHNRHRNHRLQTAFDVYGESSLKFFILEEVLTFDRNHLIEREQEWIDKYKPEYNLNPVAGNYFNTKFYSEESKQKRIAKITGRKQSPSHVKSRMDTMKKNGKQKLKRLTDVQKSHLSEINMGEKNPNWGKHRTTESKLKSHDSVSKILYTFISPTGIKRTVKGLQTSAERELSIPYWAARKLYQGKIKNWNGWTFVKSEKIDPSK